MTIQAWLSVNPYVRSRVLAHVERLLAVGDETPSARCFCAAVRSAVDLLGDAVALQDLQATEARIRREVAIAAADRCYQRAASRMAQIKMAPHAAEILKIKAGEAQAAGDDILLAADVKPTEHPRRAEMAKWFETAGRAMR